MPSKVVRCRAHVFDLFSWHVRERFDKPGQLRLVPRRKAPAGFASHHVGCATALGGNKDGQSAEHRFERHKPPLLSRTRQHKEIALSIKRSQILLLNVTLKFNKISDT